MIAAVAIGATSVATAPQAAPGGAPLPGQVRTSTRTAANRIWFQEAALRPSDPSKAPAGATLRVVAANGVTLREFIGFA